MLKITLWIDYHHKTQHTSRRVVFSTKLTSLLNNTVNFLCKTPSSWTRYIKLVKQNRLALKLKSRGGKPCAKALFFSSDRLSPRLIALFQHSVLFQLATLLLFPRVVPSLLMFISVFGGFFHWALLLLNMTQEPHLLGTADFSGIWCPSLSHHLWLVWGRRVAMS